MITRNILQLDNKSGNFFTNQNYLKKKSGCFLFKAKVQTSVRSVVSHKTLVIANQILDLITGLNLH